MITGNRRFISTIFLLFIMFYPQTAASENFKSAEFLQWKRESQDFYIDANIGMAGLIAVQNDKKHQTCIENWYLDDKPKTIESILSTMRKFPEFHPRGVILAMMEKQCGTFTYTNK